MENFVSVIIPTFNRVEYLKKAVKSVLDQTYQQLELIIVDDGSDDGTAELIAQLKQKSQRKILYIHQGNMGAAAARNRGLEAASHDFIAFLDSDDWFHPQKLAIQVDAMQANPDFLISHTQEIWYRKGKFLNQKKTHEKCSGNIYSRCLKLCAVGMSTIMLRKVLIQDIGFFDEEFICCEDYDYWLRASIKYPFLLVDNALTFKQGGRVDQLSVKFATGMDRYRIRAIEKILSSKSLSTLQARMALDELIKKCRIYGNGCIKHGRPEEGEMFLSLPMKYKERK